MYVDPLSDNTKIAIYTYVPFRSCTFYYYTYESTEEEHPSPVESIHYAIPDGKRQAVANVDTKVVDTDGCASQVGGKVVTND